MNFLALICERLLNFFRLYEIKKNQMIKTCIENNIPLTKNNISEVAEIIRTNHNRTDCQS